MTISMNVELATELLAHELGADHAVIDERAARLLASRRVTDPAGRERGKSSVPEIGRSPNDVESLPYDRSQDSSIRSDALLRARGDSHDAPNAESARDASSDRDHRFLHLRANAGRDLLPIHLQYQFNRCTQIFQTLRPRFALSIGSRHFRTKTDIPLRCFLDHGGKLIFHAKTLRSSAALGKDGSPRFAITGRGASRRCCKFSA